MSVNKKNRIISLIESTSDQLDEKANQIFEKIDEVSSIETATIGQTYRTYESRTNKGAKSFINTPFFTNSITISFESSTPAEKIAEIMADLRLTLN